MKNWFFVGLVVLLIVSCAGEGDDAQATQAPTENATDTSTQVEEAKETIETKSYTLKKGSTSMQFTGYKFAANSPVSGTFDDIEFSFENTSGSLAEILTHANALITTSKVNSSNADRDGNFRSGFFSNFDSTITASILKVTPINATSGVADVDITMNGKIVNSSFTYAVIDKKLTANGLIDLTSFGLINALQALTAIAPHGGVTSPIVDLAIGMEFI